MIAGDLRDDLATVFDELEPIPDEQLNCGCWLSKPKSAECQHCPALLGRLGVSGYPSQPGGITTAELRKRTRTAGKGWYDFAANHSPGDVRHHPKAGAWRLVGKASWPDALGGGGAPWYWEQVKD